MIGLFNPLVDRTPAGEWFGIPVTQGIISFISIILRCMLTILGAFTLLASTGFAPLCRGLEAARRAAHPDHAPGPSCTGTPSS